MSHIEIDGHRIAVLFSEAEISERIEAIAKAIAGKRPHRLLVVPVLKGSFVFAADLIRAMHRAGLSPEVDFMMLASYREKTRSSGKVEVLSLLDADPDIAAPCREEGAYAERRETSRHAHHNNDVNRRVRFA